MGYAVRDYVIGDEPSWLRCRAHHEEALPAKPAVSGAELVAVDAGVVVGILDVVVAGELATIETFAIHPDHRYRGIGGALLARARARAGALGATTLDAWTRDDPPTSRWYRAMGFNESARRPRAAAPSGLRFAMPLPSRGQLGRRGDDVDHRAVAQDGHRQR